MKLPSFQETLDQARLLFTEQHFYRAFALYRKLVRRSPGIASVWFEYGKSAMATGEIEIAEQAYEKAAKIGALDAGLLLSVGHCYSTLRLSEKASKCFAAAAELDAKAINPRISLAEELERRHDFSEARRWIEECLTIDPKEEQAQFLYAVLDFREDRFEEAERRLCQLIASEPKHPYVKYAARYELAKLLDRIGEYDKAMKHLMDAKQIVAELAPVEAVIKEYDQYIKINQQRALKCSNNSFTGWRKSCDKLKQIPPLVFLGGHPRSGTTLLEQVLNAHPKVRAFDESVAFSSTILPAYDGLHRLKEATINVLRQNYIKALAGGTNASYDHQVLVDKNPSPTMYLPLWLRVFPELRVLISLRDPRDVVLSCYFQNIPLNHVNSNFLSFERLAKHYADLMDIWLSVREWDGFAWMETRYEDIVNNLENEGRRVTNFIGLEWDAKQTRFYEKSKNEVLYTPTYHEVTQPTYSRSISRWRSYEKYMASALEILDPYCVKFGYA